MVGWAMFLYGAGCVYMWSKEHLKVVGHLGVIVTRKSLRWACTRILIALDGEQVVKLEAPPPPEKVIEGSYDVTVDEKEDDYTFHV